MNTLEHVPSVQAAGQETLPAQEVLAAARAACARIAPLWPLKNFVAVNPFLGVSQLPFAEACALYSQLVPGGMQMQPSYYQAKLASGHLTTANLAAALKSAAHKLTTTTLQRLSDPEALRTAVAELTDQTADSSQTAYGQAVVEWISHFCASYFDAGQSTWRAPWRHLPLFAAWREYAEADTTPERFGIPGFRSWVRSLPHNPETLLTHSMPALEVPSNQWPDFLQGLLLSVRGWAGHVRYREWDASSVQGERLMELLAIRVAYEAGLRHLTGYTAWGFQKTPPDTAFRIDLLILMQLAEEHAWQTRLFGALKTNPSVTTHTRPDRPAVQAVFCIDVRSEPFRRALESASPWVETRGFAGFFGVALEYLPFGQRAGTARCPVLLKPGHRVREGVAGGRAETEERLLKERRVGRRISHAWNAFRSSAISCFSFVETAGLAYGLDLLQSAFAGKANPVDQPPGAEPLLARHEGVHGGAGIALGERIQIARGFLKNLGWQERFARIVLVCGHGSGTVNNPYGSGLDCGACGGHAGDANARVCAAILNDPDVRKALAADGTRIPSDTWFVAGLHNTTTDDVTLLDTHRMPASHKDDLRQLAGWLDDAGSLTRRERAPKLGLDCHSSSLDAKVRARSKDWSQVRPEWGLAGNAAFVAAPRQRTADQNLGGRVFLHDYDWHLDTDNTVLELILTAPVVVASWINLQYYGSTVNPSCFGSGNKVLHNVVGTLGVCLGNGGDLQTGLPWQSVHDGTRWMHEPVRLHVVVEAPTERIEAILQKHPSVRALVDNGWILITALGSASLQRRDYGGVWVPQG
jgi:uncharacterized protein YbcC (UPF0753/DUF2309 family)